MTPEEKAKAYDEALKRAKAAIDIAADKDLVVGVVRTIFPEPRESEDERIRTFLLDYAIEMIAGLESDISLSTYDGIKGHDPDAEAELTQWQKARAYLEKQKDASKAIEAVDRIDKYIDEHLANAHDMKDSNPDKKYYRGWDDALGKMSGILQDVYSGEKQKEQKPAWSEEDEKMVRFYENDYDNNLGNMPMCDVIENRIKFKGWLLNKLKSIRPQPHWKPSDEQISSLKQARDYYMSGRIKYVGRHLSEIAEQLEKLM